MSDRREAAQSDLIQFYLMWKSFIKEKTLFFLQWGLCLCKCSLVSFRVFPFPTVHEHTTNSLLTAFQQGYNSNFFIWLGASVVVGVCVGWGGRVL